jgi:MFS family permease
MLMASVRRSETLLHIGIGTICMITGSVESIATPSSSKQKREDKERPSKSKRKLIVLIVSMIAVLGIAAILALALFGGTLDVWTWGIIIFVFALAVTFVPTALAMLGMAEPNVGGAHFDESDFGDRAKTRLKQHWSRIEGTLRFWKNQAAKYKNFRYYVVIWSIIITISIPIVTQFVGQNVSSRLFLTIISVTLAILLTFDRAFKVENHYRAFRAGESEFYDLYRRLLDNPQSFGADEDEQLVNYFKQVEALRLLTRKAELDLPAVEEAKTSVEGR